MFLYTFENSGRTSSNNGVSFLEASFSSYLALPLYMIIRFRITTRTNPVHYAIRVPPSINPGTGGKGSESIFGSTSNTELL